MLATVESVSSSMEQAVDRICELTDKVSRLDLGRANPVPFSSTDVPGTSHSRLKTEEEQTKGGNQQLLQVGLVD